MGKSINLVGQKFDQLEVIEKTNKRGTYGDVVWLCKCDCGKTCERTTGVLKNKRSKKHSCGCYNTETIKKHQYINKKPFNKFVIENDIVNIYSDKYKDKFVTIDLKWLEYFKDYHLWYDERRDVWSIFQNGKSVDIHQIIAGKYCDHIDRNRDNCLESNLRSATHAENCRNRGIRSDNTTGYKGVGRRGNKFRGYITVDGKSYRTKNYDTAEQAAIERDDLAVIHHKEFAYLNFPELLNNYISEINNV